MAGKRSVEWERFVLRLNDLKRGDSIDRKGVTAQHRLAMSFLRITKGRIFKTEALSNGFTIITRTK